MINCGPHPHNYYLDILANIGLIGFFLILLFIFLTLFYSSFVKRYFIKSNNHKSMLITPFIFLFFTEIFPIKTSEVFLQLEILPTFFNFIYIGRFIVVKKNLN